MKQSLIYGLLLSVLMVTAPHADHLPLWVSALSVTLLVWRGYLAYSGHPLPKRALLTTITLASLVGIIIEFHTLFGREVGVTLLMLLATLKLMELKAARDAMALIYLSCFIIITNFFYSQSLITGLYMIATLFVITASWVHLNAQGCAFKPRIRIAAVLLLQAIPLAVILFVLFPRVQGPLWGLPQDAFNSSGLDDKMSPGSMGRLALSDEVAFRVTYHAAPPRRDQMYWRGPVLSDFDGTTWTRGRSGRSIAPEFSDIAQPVEYTVTLEPSNKNWLFALEMPNNLSIPARLTHDFQVLSMAPVSARLTYDARSQLLFHANINESPTQLHRALQLPVALNPLTLKLAADWREHHDDAGVVRSALDYFHQQAFHYTLEPVPLTGQNSIDDFLFTTRQGFCEHYASAFVYLMRAAGIPARVVTGYQGGEFNKDSNYYIVRQSDAHAWAEVWLKGRGWIRTDPTASIAPARVERNLSAALPDNTALPFIARTEWLRELRLNWDAISYQWNRWVVGYNNERQLAFLSRLGLEPGNWRQMAIYMVSALALVTGLFALFMLRHLLTRETDKTQAIWLKLCRKLEKAGLPRAPHEGPLDYSMRVKAARPDLACAMEDLTGRYLDLRYGSIADERALLEFIQRAAKFDTSKNK